MTAADRAQDAGQDGVRLEISPPGQYTRAGAYETGGAPGEPIGLELPGPAGKIAVLDGPTGPAPAPAEQPAANPARYPLRRRGRNLREAGHAAYYDAKTPEEGLDAAFNYFRAAVSRADKGDMPHPAADDALIDIGRVLMTVGDDLTAEMHTWSPQP